MNLHKKFGGIPEEFAKYDKSKIVLLPVPFDGTSTWQKGADKGFEAFIEASENMELYDIETDSEVYKNGISILNAITEKSSPEAMVEAVHKSVQHQIKRNKFVTLFGGEHSISIGAIRAFYETYENLTVLHLDAHADLRKEYEGSKYNHACAVYEASQHTNLIQIGIRSMDASEKLTMDFEKVYFAHEIAQDNFWMDSALEQMTENVFITFDLDVFDPSIMPSTGTPEPGGLFWNETLEFLNKVFGEKNVVGFDIVELCPNSNNKAPDFLAAKLYYKMLSYKFSNNTNTTGFEEDYDDNFDSPFAKLSKFKDNDNDGF
jgi:agmatinase